MGETLLLYQQAVSAPDGTRYQARACGGPLPGGTWQGWIEFVPLAGGDAIRSPRETTQPNRSDTEYWATGLTPIYLEGALVRALAGPAAPVPATATEPSIFAGPAAAPAAEPAASSILDPFSVYQKGEALLRRQLGALSTWHLVNIISAYELSAEPTSALQTKPAAALIDTIVAGVRSQRTRATR